VTSFIRLYKKLTSSVKKTNWAQTTSSWLVSPMMSSLGIQVQTSQEYFSFLEMCFGVYPILRNVTVPKNSVGAKQLGANFDFIAIKQAFIRSFLCTYLWGHCNKTRNVLFCWMHERHASWRDIDPPCGTNKLQINFMGISKKKKKGLSLFLHMMIN